MKTLYYGGQKSGKSLLAEKKALSIATNKPYYIATYNNSYGDTEMAERISKHQLQRQDEFVSIEETFDLSLVIQDGETYLIDCISMWILNTLEQPQEEILAQLGALGEINANIIFVLNNVTEGVIPFDKESRKYVDRSGVIGQKLATLCDEVYEVKLGLEIKLK